MIRVDHAGERGADTIYNGQWDVLKDTESGDLIKVRIRRSHIKRGACRRWSFGPNFIGKTHPTLPTYSWGFHEMLRP